MVEIKGWIGKFGGRRNVEGEDKLDRSVKFEAERAVNSHI